MNRLVFLVLVLLPAFAESRFAGTWEDKVNDQPGVKLTVVEQAGKLSGTILFCFQTRGSDGKWRVAEQQGSGTPILSPKIEGGLLTFEVRHHIRHGGPEYGPNKRYTVELTGEGARMRPDDASAGKGLLLSRAR